MPYRQEAEPRRFVFPQYAADPDPLTFLYRKPTAAVMADYHDELLDESRAIENGRAPKNARARGVSKATLKLAAMCTVSWSGYLDAKGEPVPFSLDAFLAFEDGTMMQQYVKHLDGVFYPKDEAEKNSARPSAQG
jgi:hypothetical protein